MKSLKLIICSLIVLISLYACNKPHIEANYEVIPLPQIITETTGNGFSLNKKTKIVYSPENERQKRTAEFLAEYIQFATGLSLSVTDQPVSKNAIILKINETLGKPESYFIEINSNQISIEGVDDAGIFYGVQTIRKSIPANTENFAVLFPSAKIEDYPRFSYRGMHLDVSRHFFPVEFIKKYIDILALHNLNRFHWHLTDDQGWRIEIKQLPELTEIGSKRAQTVIGRNTGEFDGIPYGGYFTQEEAKEIVAYAQERFITIIPEIDLPGHMVAALTAYPELGCTGGPYEVIQTWGIYPDVLCAGNEKIFTFLETVFSEIVEIFPSEYIHVGGDECPKIRWEACPKCQAKIKELKIKGDKEHSAEFKLQSYVITRIEQFLNSKGRQIIGWEEILEGGIAPNATVMSWRGKKAELEAVRQGHDVIMVPKTNCYFDYYQTRDTENEPLAIGNYVPVERVYSFEPIPDVLTAEERKHIIGTQANLWSEYILSPSHAEYMLLPRLTALSEVQWATPDKKDYDYFLTRLSVMTDLFKKLDYNYATHVFETEE